MSYNKYKPISSRRFIMIVLNVHIYYDKRLKEDGEEFKDIIDALDLKYKSMIDAFEQYKTEYLNSLGEQGRLYFTIWTYTKSPSFIWKDIPIYTEDSIDKVIEASGRLIERALDKYTAEIPLIKKDYENYKRNLYLDNKDE